MDLIKTMYENNPDGAGYMLQRDGTVCIHKGFMTVEDLIRALKEDNITSEDVVVYHFRITTQAGVQPSMTQPFPYSKNVKDLQSLDISTRLGIAHNGIIKLTTDYNNKVLSDTALFIKDYIHILIGYKKDLQDERKMALLQACIGSKMAFLDFNGDIYTVGDFHTDKETGLVFSNYSYIKREPVQWEQSSFNWWGNNYYTKNKNKNK